MKLRIRGNSVRLRLTRGEVARLVSEGVVAEQAQFGSNLALRYSIAKSDTPEISATLDGTHVQIRAPKTVVDRWAQSDEVGFESPPGAALKIVVEKDWNCLTPRAEDDQDTYPNPNQTC